MSTRTHKAIFERPCEPDKKFSSELTTWEEIAREFVSLTPQPIGTQRPEFVDAAQIKTTSKTIAACVWSPTMAAIDTSCRMKVGERIFNIETILNVDEMNRELQFLVIEKL